MTASKSQVAKQQILIERDGQTVVLLAGARLPANDPVVKANPSLFEAEKRGGVSRDRSRGG
jgi:hypothetical protein